MKLQFDEQVAFTINGHEIRGEVIGKPNYDDPLHQYLIRPFGHQHPHQDANFCGNCLVPEENIRRVEQALDCDLQDIVAVYIDGLDPFVAEVVDLPHDHEDDIGDDIILVTPRPKKRGMMNSYHVKRRDIERIVLLERDKQ